MSIVARAQELEANLAGVEARISAAATQAGRERSEITLICVTKNFPASDANILAALGQRNFGENRDREGAEKSELVKGIWHFQGQIQSNKIKSIAQWADVVHSIDTREQIESFAWRRDQGRTLGVFLQLSLDGSEGRGGTTAAELVELGRSVMASPTLELLGLMCVPPVSRDPDGAMAEIAAIHKGFLTNFPKANSLSMGMSNDFESAIRHGATHIRVGTSILGSRSPHE
jgi:pyridoxal phosphate enzyme (YggS family)